MKKTFHLISLLLLASCASSNDIFPSLPTSLNSDDIALPNPIAIIADDANGQIILVNSEVDFLYEEGDIVTISVDATDPLAPVLTATSLITTPRYAGSAAFDGTSLYVPFRTKDQIIKYTVGAGSITETAEASVGKDPFGVTIDGAGNILVASNNELNILDSDLTSVADVDLRAATQDDIPSASGKRVENVAVDTVNNRAYISNRRGKILIVDLTSNELTHVIGNPNEIDNHTPDTFQNTRGILTNPADNFIYATEGNPPALVVLDPSLLPAPTAEAPDEIDDAVLLQAQVDVELNPNGIAIDAVNNRAFVTNTSDKSVSVIDLTLFKEIQRISLKNADTGFETGVDPFAVDVGIFGGASFVFVANFKSNNVTVIHAATLQVVASFP